MWKNAIGGEGLAVQAPWPTAEEEDKVLTRECKFLGDAMKSFRQQLSKGVTSKKGGVSAEHRATIIVSECYPGWKIDVLKWMHGQYNAMNKSFPDTFMSDLKVWTNNLSDKKMIKLSMQFASWMKKEVSDVGFTAMDLNMPYDQKSILISSEKYIKSQLSLPSVEVLSLSEERAAVVPDRIAENVTPGRPFLWIH
jgi:hypothetical protein